MYICTCVFAKYFVYQLFQTEQPQLHIIHAKQFHLMVLVFISVLRSYMHIFVNVHTYILLLFQCIFNTKILRSLLTSLLLRFCGGLCLLRRLLFPLLTALAMLEMLIVIQIALTSHLSLWTAHTHTHIFKYAYYLIRFVDSSVIQFYFNKTISILHFIANFDKRTGVFLYVCMYVVVRVLKCVCFSYFVSA